MRSYDDVLCSVPYQCDDKDCSQQWHLATFWTYVQGKRTSYSVDSLSDGDHETCSKKDIPSVEDQDKAWREYSQFVLETGTDPLGNFIVQRETQTEVTWTVQFRKWSGENLLVYGARRGHGKTIFPERFPEYLAKFVQLRKIREGLYEAEGVTKNDLKSSPTGKVTTSELGLVLHWTGKVEKKTPRSEKAIAADLRKLAKKHLTRK